MTRATIDFGIDLGTTNSAIARIDGVEAEIVRNNEGFETTPSAVMVDRRDRIYVGRMAKEASESNPENTAVEFKTLMGRTGQAKTFPASGRSMEPEALSAEVLRSLRSDVRQRTGEDITAAVITVPAAFDLGACDATRRAAELAGLTQAPLLQEPTAAALAYGFQDHDEDAFWLVYDLGGGTFDAAVISLRDGEFTVVNHRGDNHLGGKLLDWAIVDELLVPQVAGHPGFAGISRSDPAWSRQISKLKRAAETAKIRASRADSASLVVDLHDLGGRLLEFDYDLMAADVERLMEPFLVRSINHCRAALEDGGLTPADLEKVLLVGGPTLSPYLRERLADPRRGLGIPLDHSQDPITVVARGAAVFAASRHLDAVHHAPPEQGSYAVELAYTPVGPDTEPFVGGRVTGADAPGLRIEFVNAESRPPWRSGLISVDEEGTFTTTLFAQRGRANTFRIEVTDRHGTVRPVTPGSLTYTVGITESAPPLIQSIGVGLMDNTVAWLFKRGTPLPARRRIMLRTGVAAQPGKGDAPLRIPVLEGENDRADRNRRIGRLEILSESLRRAIPESSEVEFTLSVDESRLMVARAYLPVLDEEFEHVINLHTETVAGQEELRREAVAEKKRLRAARAQSMEFDDAQVQRKLDRIEEERVVQDIDAMIERSETDASSAAAAGERIRDLRAAVDELEDELLWPVLVQQAKEVLDDTMDFVREVGMPKHHEQLPVYAEAVLTAITAHDPDLLRRRTEELQQFALRVLDESGHLVYMAFDQLQQMLPEMRDQAEAMRLIESGRRAAEARDEVTLGQINALLGGHLSQPPPPPNPFSSVVA